MCGYVYEKEMGDPDNGVLSKTKFEDLLDEWIYPMHGTEKNQFKKL